MPGIGCVGLDHVSVVVTDLERARHFYRDVLGLREIAKPKTFDFVVLWFELGGQQLHLLQKPAADPPGPRHFALRVADIGAARARALGAGLAVEETVPIPGAERFFVYDPDANRVEIIAWREPYDPATGGADTFDGDTRAE